MQGHRVHPTPGLRAALGHAAQGPLELRGRKQGPVGSGRPVSARRAPPVPVAADGVPHIAGRGLRMGMPPLPHEVPENQECRGALLFPRKRKVVDVESR